MMEPTEKYRVKLRHKNNIFTTVMFGYMLDDIHLKGEKSSVITNLNQKEITGVATGVFRDAVEVMYVESMLEPQEQMDVQVYLFSFIFLRK